MKDILLYTHFYKNYPFHESDFYLPVSNEKCVTNPVCKIIPKYVKDETIILGEFDTFIYLSQSKKEANYIGVNQYRRYPDFDLIQDASHGAIMEPTKETFSYLASKDQKEKALNLLNNYDVLAYHPVDLGVNYVQQWSRSHPEEAFNILLEELSLTEYKNSIDYFYQTTNITYLSLMISKWEYFVRFSTFYKFLVDRLLQRKDFIDLFSKPSADYRWRNTRLLALLGERLLPFWFFHNKFNIGRVRLIKTENI